ncbi:MAG: protein translocase subunit SecF [Alphaproteobacteria bacterium]|nr:protein translocase subunit SecF [Alphaproteobacteria bacterium]
MMLVRRFLPQDTKYDFVSKRLFAYALTCVLVVGSCVSMATKGFNFGIDFAGGILMEVKTKSGPADLALMRSTVSHLELGEVALQEFGAPDLILIRLQRQEGGEQAQQAAVVKVKAALGEGYDYRRTEFVGPKVGEELIRGGILAVVLSVLAIAVYIWFRFEWQFGIGALVATFHDVITTFGVFSLTGLEFNLTSVAALLTIVGYSINDTVVEYDRVRENLRKYKSMNTYDIINLSVNETLARTFLTGGTVFVSVLALLLFGGEVIRGFSVAMLWGVIVGTYSSIYVAMPILYHFDLRSITKGKAAAAADETGDEAS